jgi:hypothetical protein
MYQEVLPAEGLRDTSGPGPWLVTLVYGKVSKETRLLSRHESINFYRNSVVATVARLLQPTGQRRHCRILPALAAEAALVGRRPRLHTASTGDRSPSARDRCESAPARYDDVVLMVLRTSRAAEPENDMAPPRRDRDYLPTTPAFLDYGYESG